MGLALGERGAEFGAGATIGGSAASAGPPGRSHRAAAWCCAVLPAGERDGTDLRMSLPSRLAVLRVACCGVVSGCVPLSSPTSAPSASASLTRSTTAVLVGPRAPQIAGGSHHTCAILPDGDVACWGDNNIGQLGDGTGRPSRVPVRVAGVHGVVALTSGLAHTCALQRAGTVWCWGDNYRGHLGMGTNSAWENPHRVKLLTNVVSLVATDIETCAVQDATVWCWGSEPLDAPAVLSPEPRRLLPSGTQEICAGPSYMCARHDGEVSCWNTLERGADANEVPGLADAEALACETKRACAVRGDGSVACWGSGSGAGWWSMKTVPGIDNASDVTVGGGHACALHHNGAVSCWGDGDHGETGTFSQFPVAVQAVRVPSPMTAIGLGKDHSCGRLRDGRFACWGSNARGASGWGKEPLSLVPEPIIGLRGIDHIIAGEGFTCVLRRDEALCWGQVTGLQPVAELKEPTPVDAFRQSRGVATLSGNNCVWAADRSARCLLGTPIPIRDVLQIVPMVIGSDPWVLRSDGVWRTPFTAARFTPDDFADASVVPASKAPTIVEIAAWKTRGVCARLQGGAVRCRDSDTDQALALVLDGPRATRPLMDVRALRSNDMELCAILGDGTVACMSQWAGQVTAAVEVVPGLRDVVELVVGGAHFCARTRGGEVLCWGGNHNGQLGDGTTVYGEQPGKVPSMTGVRELAAGAEHTCALTQEREVYCWGDHSGNGRLAHAAANERSAMPVYVGDANP